MVNPIFALQTKVTDNLVLYSSTQDSLYACGVGLGDIGIGDMRLLHSHSMRLLQYCM